VNDNTKISFDNPKLSNYYGDSFDYKNNFGEGTISQRLQSKKLNAEREIKKARTQKKLDELNFVSIKENLKIKNNFKKSSLKMDFKSEVSKLQTRESSLNTKLDLSNFISLEIKSIKENLKENFINAKRTISSLKTTGDSPEIIQQKINETYLFAEKKEVKYEKLLTFFKEYNQTIKKTNPNDYNSLKEYSLPSNLLCDDEKLNVSLVTNINKKIVNAFLAYNSQYFFRSTEEEKLQHKIDDAKKLNALKLEYKINKNKNKLDLKKSFDTEKKSISTKAKNEISASKENYKEAKRVLTDVNGEFVKLNEVERLSHIENKENIKSVTKQNKKDFKIELKTFKDNHKKDINEDLGLKLLVANPLLFFGLKNNTYRSNLSDLKAQNKVNLGSQLKEFTFNGDYMETVGRAKLNFNKYDREIKQEFTTNYKEQIAELNAIPQDSLEAEKVTKKEEISLRVSEFKTLKSDIIKRYKAKDISKEAKKTAIIKEKIFMREDIRVSKMGSEFAKVNFSVKESLVTYSKENKLNKNNYLQNVNNTSRTTPIEVKKNISFLYAILGFFFPGADALLLKN
jgi:hypothetical protein